jgi:4'-phosphopantetheinyl transferase
LEHIDVWRVRLDEPQNESAENNVLSPDEIARATLFHFEKDRARFRRCRFALRTLLSDYLAIPASEILIEYLESGKPQLAAKQNLRSLQFNVSHSADLALIAFGSEHRLGVDIEKVRADVDTSALASRFFSPHERDALQSLPDHLRLDGFFACWTRKEAFLKATGDGLSFPLADFSVTPDPDRDPRLEELQGDVATGERWFLSDLRGIEGFRAALAVERSSSHLNTYAWN